MKKKSIIISIIVILILIISGLFIYNLPKEEPIEPMPTVEPIEEETTVEIETTTEEVNALKSDPSIPTFNAKQGTVEVVSNKEPEIPLGTAPSEVEKSDEDTVNLEIIEDQQFRNETAHKMVEQAKEYYKQGLITKEEYDGIIEGAKTLEEGIQWDLPEDLTTPHIDVDVPGTTPSDQQSIEDMAQQLIADYLKDYAQDNQVEVDYPGMTPHDPSQDGQIVIGDNPALAGDYIN